MGSGKTAGTPTRCCASSMGAPAPALESGMGCSFMGFFDRFGRALLRIDGIDVVEGDVNASLMGRRNDSPRHLWRHILALPLVVADVALRDTNSSSKRGLGKADLLTHSLDVVRTHARIISRTAMRCQQSGCFASISPRNNLFLCQPNH